MITISNINKAIVERLKKYGCVITKDIKNPNPPCWYISFIANNKTEIANQTYQVRYSFNINYFSDVENLLDLTKSETLLKQAFQKPLKVEYQNEDNETLIKFIRISSYEVDFNEEDYILNCVINFDFIYTEKCENEYDEYVNDETMETLEMDF